MKRPTVRELLTKIEQLEARIRQLEAVPRTEIHYHQHPLQPLPAYGPAWIAPQTPIFPNLPAIWCGGSPTAGMIS